MSSGFGIFVKTLKFIFEDGARALESAMAFIEHPSAPFCDLVSDQTWERTVAKGLRLPDGSSLIIGFPENAVMICLLRLRPVRIRVLFEIAPMADLTPPHGDPTSIRSYLFQALSAKHFVPSVEGIASIKRTFS
jgi:hypothetical protein